MTPGMEQVAQPKLINIRPPSGHSDWFRDGHVTYGLLESSGIESC
jgi:hypothetical protein